MLKFAVAAAALAAASNASAATIVGSTSSSATDAGIYFNYTANVGGVFGNNDPTVVSSKFADTFSFTTSFERLATIVITSSMPVGDWSKNVNFATNGSRLNGTVIPTVSTGLNENRTLINFRIPAGVSTIFLTGSAGANGIYNGVLTLAGVPEPATWGLMILGFGAVAAMMRRRRANVSVAYS